MYSIISLYIKITLFNTNIVTQTKGFHFLFKSDLREMRGRSPRNNIKISYSVIIDMFYIHSYMFDKFEDYLGYV